MSGKSTPLYGQIIDYLKEQIDDGKILPGGKLPTEQELAELFDVSRITSRRALVELEREGMITRLRGRGSFLTHSAQRKAVRGQKIIGLLLPFGTSLGGMMHAIQGASELARERGYHLDLHITDRSSAMERELIESLLASQVSGIICYPVTDKANLDLIYKLYTMNYPIVFIDKLLEGIPISSVVPDNVKGGYMAARHLLDRGHRKISFVAAHGIEALVSVKHRFFGYCNALQEHGGGVDLDIVRLGIGHHSGNSVRIDEEGREAVAQLIEELLSLGVTAVQMENDYVALNFIDVARDIGVNVPDDLSVVGFDNIDQADGFGISLTTINQNFYDLGRVAVESVIDLLENDNSEYVAKVLPVSLVERQSTAALDRHRRVEVKV